MSEEEYSDMKFFSFLVGCCCCVLW